MRTGRFFLIILIIIFSQSAFSRPIRVKANNEPLSSIVKRLNVEISFDYRLLSEYRVTVDKSFNSPDAAIKYLIKDKPLLLKKVDGVYILTAREKTKKKPAPQVIYTYMQRKIPDTYPMDLSMSLKEIVITAPNHTPSLREEDGNGLNRFTSVTANVMPGSSDNSVFNVLRMMPGIRASGEPSDELYVWGSSPGESRVALDGIPLFAMQSYNSNISYINPYIAEEVNYKRGILSADEGSLTGAKVDVISGITHYTRPTFMAMVSTMSANVFGAVPIGKQSLVTAAYRHTLQGLFGGTSFDTYRNKAESSSSEKNHTDGQLSADSSATVTPHYDFQDANLNIAGKMGPKTSYKVNLYGAWDYLRYDFNDSVRAQMSQTDYQGGVSARIRKEWDNGNSSQWSSFVSALYARKEGSFMIDKTLKDTTTTERVTQWNVRFGQQGIGSVKGLSLGAELSLYRVKSLMNNHDLAQPTVFADERWKMGALNVEVGMRTDFMNDGVNWQPRILVSYPFLNDFTFTSSWGVYQQYLVKNPYSSISGGYQFDWDINTSLKSYNTVAGLSYHHDGLNLAVEGYLKKLHHSMWVVNNVTGLYDFNLKGVDVSAKYNWRRGLLFASWSLSDDPRQTDGVANELKAGTIMRFYPFTVSANYVFGHGYNSMLLPSSSFGGHGHTEHDLSSSTSISSTGTTYSRMDIYASYEKRFKYVGITIGASLINVFDTSNQKYVTSWAPHSVTSSFTSQASRFTPIVFFEIRY